MVYLVGGSCHWLCSLMRKCSNHTYWSPCLCAFCSRRWISLIRTAHCVPPPPQYTLRSASVLCCSRNTCASSWTHTEVEAGYEITQMVSLRQPWAAHSQSFTLSFVRKPNSSDSLRQWYPVWGLTPVGLCALLLLNYCFLFFCRPKSQLQDNKGQSSLTLYVRPRCINQRWWPEENLPVIHLVLSVLAASGSLLLYFNISKYMKQSSGRQQCNSIEPH